MPIISTVGSRSPKTRMLLGSIYLVLLVGAASMLYPLLLMLSGSLKSEPDFARNTPVPEFLWDDQLLWSKYLASKYSLVPHAEAAQHRVIGRWETTQPPPPVDVELVEAFRRFRLQEAIPVEWFNLGHLRYRDILAKNARAYRRQCQRDFASIETFSDAVGLRYTNWSDVGPPYISFASRRFTFPQTLDFAVLYELKGAAPKHDWVWVNVDGDFWRTYLLPQWPTVDAYNAAHGTTFATYDEVLLSTRPPPPGQARNDWQTYVREQLNLAFIRFDPAGVPAFRDFLRGLYRDDLAALNRKWGQLFVSFDEVTLPTGLPTELGRQVDLALFLKNRQACPLEILSIEGPRQAFERFIAARRGLPAEQVQPLPLPIEAADWLDLQENKSSVRWEFLTRNYSAVIDYLLLHGNGIRNTIIFCGLMIATTLLVNPLAAYALSRYRPPSTYAILLFCMATMAFPGEVTMIPSFLLLKRFPLYSLAVGCIIAFGVAWLLHRLRPRTSMWLFGMTGVGVGVLAGWWFVPLIGKRFFGADYVTVSLLNTFWALVLPGMANGFSIFLLKGFFDSLPRELYEAADLDGASEWHKFWMITMSLSKPILAVLALGAFTAAYSEFLMALVIIPDQEMWTLMVWLYQLQYWSHPSVIYASLVVAAIPTLVIFLLCQNVIMRGIVVPTER
jgi:ABC-type glycerol-3-phosphate transport system permease component